MNEFNRNAKPSDMTDNERRAIVDNPSLARHGLYSAELSMAHDYVQNSNDPMLHMAFKQLCFSLLGGNGTDLSSNEGFNMRNSVGTRVNEVFGADHDITRFDQLCDKTEPYSPQGVVHDQLNMLRLALVHYFSAQGIEVTSHYTPNATSSANVKRTFGI